MTGQSFDAALSENEKAEFALAVQHASVTGHALVDLNGKILTQTAVSDGIARLAASIIDRTEAIGAALGEANPRPAVKIGGSDREIVALPMAKASLVLVRSKSAA